MRSTRFTFIILLAIVALSLASCRAGSRVEVTLDDVESYVNERPDSALAVLERIDSSALTTRSLRARYSLLRTMAQAKSYRDLTVPGLIDDAANDGKDLYSNNCKSHFSVLTGTIFENTHLDSRMWLYAMNLVMVAKKSISACQLQRDLV